MNKRKRKYLISATLIILSILFTILVKVVDVKQIGVNGTNIGFATINKFVLDTIGINMTWYHITYYLGIIPIFIAIIYALIGFVQLIKRKSLYKVDKEIIILGIYYIIVILTYIFFEKIIINYRPVLINGSLEASYPSSHTLITICLCGSFIIVNKKIFNNNLTKPINYLSLIIIAITVIGRLISGVHWLTDIIGGIIIATTLLMILYLLIYEKK